MQCGIETLQNVITCFIYTTDIEHGRNGNCECVHISVHILVIVCSLNATRLD